VDAPPRVLDQDNRSMGILSRVNKIAILAGNGAVRSGAAAELRNVAETFKIPVATTLRAKGIFPEDHPLSLGVFGYGGTRHSTLAIAPKTDPFYDPSNRETADWKQAELLLILGSGLNQRDTMFWSPQLPKYSVQVDIDAAAFGRNYPVPPDPQSDYPERTAVLADVREFLRWMQKEMSLKDTIPARQRWLSGISLQSRYYDLDNTRSDARPIHPARVVAELRNAAPRDCALLVDSGAHRVFAAHYWRSFVPRSYFTSTTLASMGWAIAAAIGVKIATPSRPCAVITGDGCMLMHGNEIQTAARYGLGIIFVVINNSAHGNIYLGVKQNPAAAWLTRLPTHNWAQYAQALGADGVMVDKPADLAATFQAAFARPSTAKPLVIDVRCDLEAATPVGPWKRAMQASLE
jgi:acetolactate synthase-1/2/3 large subunit